MPGDWLRDPRGDPAGPPRASHDDEDVSRVPGRVPSGGEQASGRGESEDKAGVDPAAGEVGQIQEVQIDREGGAEGERLGGSVRPFPPDRFRFVRVGLPPGIRPREFTVVASNLFTGEMTKAILAGEVPFAVVSITSKRKLTLKDYPQWDSRPRLPTPNVTVAIRLLQRPPRSRVNVIPSCACDRFSFLYIPVIFIIQ